MGKFGALLAPLALTLLLAACGRPELSDIDVEGNMSDVGPAPSLGVAQPAHVMEDGRRAIPQLRTVMGLSPGA